MDKKETVVLKAFAVMLMFWHHLFGCGTCLTGGVEYEWIPFLGSTIIEEFVGMGCKLCISLFACASGYGIYKSYINSGRYTKIVSSICKFLIQYWVIVFIFAIPYLLLFNKFNVDYLFVNLFALLHNDEILYVSLSWYVKVNILFLMISPLVKYVSGKVQTFNEELFIFIIIPIIASRVLPDSESHYENLATNILSSVRLLFQWFPVFYLGILLAKYKVIEKIRGGGYRQGESILFNCMASILMMCVTIVIRLCFQINIILELFCTFIFVISFDYIYVNMITKLKFVDIILSFLGTYSFQFWLLSGMFYLNTTEFLWLLYKPKLSILIFAWNFVILIPFVIIAKKMAMELFEMLDRKILGKYIE